MSYSSHNEREQQAIREAIAEADAYRPTLEEIRSRSHDPFGVLPAGAFRDLRALLALVGARDVELDRERRRVAAEIAILNTPMWKPDDETDSTICRCDWCLAETARLAVTYRCRDCGYQGQPMAWGCLDQENVERMSRERGERYSLGQVICPICGGGQGFEADPWKALRAIRAALAADAPGQPGEEGQSDGN